MTITITMTNAIKIAIKLPFASVSKRVLVQSLSYEN